jgi:hypothetical protein
MMQDSHSPNPFNWEILENWFYLLAQMTWH